MATKSCSLLLIHLFLFITGGQGGTRLNFFNQCKYTVWLSAFTTIGLPSPELEPGSGTFLETPDTWAGSIWVRTGCTYNDSTLEFYCDTGDCGYTKVCDGPLPKFPITIVNFIIQGTRVLYDVNLLHGYNVPVLITPADGSKSCPTIDCAGDLMKVCPSELVFKNKDGLDVGCKSACDAVNEKKFCCSGEYANPVLCKPNEYSLVFKKLCPLALTYTWDDSPPISRCTTLANFNITFCPL